MLGTILLMSMSLASIVFKLAYSQRVFDGKREPPDCKV